MNEDQLILEDFEMMFASLETNQQKRLIKSLLKIFNQRLLQEKSKKSFKSKVSQFFNV